MPVLTTTQLSHAYGAADLFHDLSLAVEPRDRIGLVGPNGVGKTTLLLALAGLLEPLGGRVDRAGGLTLGYLRQEAVLTFAGRENTVYQEMLTAFADLRRQESELQVMEKALAEAYSESLLAAYGELQETFEREGGYQYQVDVKRVLQGLGFEPGEWNTPLLHLSGGQKTRVLLGRLLLEKPDLLILDEPTNHLDMAAIEWLEGTLRRWEGALIIVSHDRYFLDRVVNRIWELLPGGGDAPAELHAYRGNYSAYVAQRREAWERAERLYTEEKARLESEAGFIRRHIAGGQTDIAKGRLRQLTRDLALIEEVGLVAMAESRRGGQSWIELGTRARTLTITEAEERIRAIRPPGGRPPRLTIRLGALERGARVVLRLKNAVIGYPDRPLFTAEEAKLERGGRAAVLGANGSGKSTLLRTILGELDPLDGEVALGDGVQVGYFAQAHDRLVPERQIIEEIWARSDMGQTEARGYLAHYLFRGDEVFKRVADLSGGERGRLALALLALEGANFLLLDEPTNHLDIASQEVLQEVLEAFDGTILLVSHDRYLVDRLARHIWSLEDGKLVTYPATYQEYLAGREETAGPAAGDRQSELHEGSMTVVVEGETPVNGDAPSAAAEKSPAAPRGWSKDARRRDERRRRQVEETIDDVEFWLSQATEALEAARTAGDEGEIRVLEAECLEAREQLEALLAEWELLA
ncbi:MAG: ABC-F family ATP-binding cassette domain-containing protein [Anaerolineae bacterium]|nr:ABC-F family ATP-binding cassette domain-containing protein [Anaerolineae bacterium]